MAFSIRLTEDEEILARRYAALMGVSMGEAFKQALFEKIEDEYDQIQQVRKMGDIKDLAGMIPGMDRAIKDVDIDNDKAFKGTEAIIKSMTPYEREHPECLNGSRRRRIAMGSGTTIADVNKLIKQFENSQKMMKMAMDGSLAARLKGMR